MAHLSVDPRWLGSCVTMHLENQATESLSDESLRSKWLLGETTVHVWFKVCV